MPYLIDGHNLIPKIPGMSLRQLDDEQRLIDLLSAFQRAKPTQIEVFFDQAAPGNAGKKRQGGLTVHFVFRSSTADQAIAHRLASLGKAARNWTVVTSDRRVQEEARSRQAGVQPSEAFARDISEALRAAEQRNRADPPPIHPDEVDEWLEFFNDDDPPA